VAVKFLSEEWASAVTDALNSNEAFQQQAQGKTVRVQQLVTTPEESRFYFTLQDGKAQVVVGELPDAEATLIQDYDTAVALMKNELNATAAYMSGKLKIQGDLMKLMQLQSLFATLPRAIKDVDVEY
jgi:putative sterol carrier protein